MCVAQLDNKTANALTNQERIKEVHFQILPKFLRTNSQITQIVKQ